MKLNPFSISNLGIAQILIRIMGKEENSKLVRKGNIFLTYTSMKYSFLEQTVIRRIKKNIDGC